MAVSLTNKERIILDVLLAAEKSMTASEVTATGSDLNANTVQSVVRTLLKRGLIEVADIVYSGTVLSRSYRISPAGQQYAVSEFAEGFRNLRKMIPTPQLFAALVDGDLDDKGMITELERMIEQKKQSLKEGE